MFMLLTSFCFTVYGEMLEENIKCEVKGHLETALVALCKVQNIVRCNCCNGVRNVMCINNDILL